MSPFQMWSYRDPACFWYKNFYILTCKNVCKYFYLEILFDCLETSVIVARHGIIVVDALFLEIDDSRTPVHAQLNGNKNEIVGKKFNFSGPAFQWRKTGLQQFWIEECVCGVDLWPIVLILAAMDNHLLVKVDHLVIEPLQATQCRQVLARDGDAIGVDQDLSS